jgi:hypothetical protein
MANSSLSEKLLRAKPGRVKLFAWPCVPQSARELIQVTFTVLVWLTGLGSLYQLFRFHDVTSALHMLLVTYLLAVMFPVYYGLYALSVKGEIDRDVLNERSIKTGRAVLRNLWLFCAAVLLGWAIRFAPTFDLQLFGLPLLGVFVTIAVLGLVSRAFSACIPTAQDQGIKTR